MAFELPNLPDGFAWRSAPERAGELTLWNTQVVARIEPNGRWWQSQVNVCFHPSLHRKTISATKRDACYWVHCWAIAQAEAIYLARPRSCSLVVPRTLIG
jgi:hypothetical protein